MKTKPLLILLATLALGGSLRSQSTVDDIESNRIYQYFVPTKLEKGSALSGAYLWIPPKTPRIRAVMVGIHNGLPMNILQHPAIRAVCRKHGIAQILLTPNGSEIGPVMLKDLNYDITNPDKTAVYDAYLNALAEVSGHPELPTAPIVPLAHSAYMSFPFEAAMRNPEQCLAILPIKAGMPDVYAFYAESGKAKAPNPALAMNHVPILFISSSSQETVGWSAYPHGHGSASFFGAYRRDRDDNPGTTYEPRNELIGTCWDMMSGHFDMLPRNYQFTADWLDAVAAMRLPEKPGDPLKKTVLADGWLVNPNVPVSGELPADFPQPAPYADFKGSKAKAAWYPNEVLARAFFDLVCREPRKDIGMFTFLDPAGKPISLAHGSMAVMPDPQALLQEDGQFTLTTYPFDKPFEVCTVKDKEHAKRPNDPHTLENVLFPGKTTLPVDKIPLQIDPHGGAVEVVRREEAVDERGLPQTRFTLRFKPYRMSPEGGFQMLFLRVFHEGDATHAAAGRTVQISWWPGGVFKDAPSQTITFPAIPDSPAAVEKVALNATSSSGLPVGYFVLKGPGIIREGAFVPSEIPEGTKNPIEVTVGAYQMGRYSDPGRVKPASTVYQTFRLMF
ncbi:MAG: hypothetical protein SFU85_06705 [Candidatus Methylacidiphilales bacterium]|nr:hypothetical protein [Candidatus Methylacidiphilales bacterium]